MRDAAGKHRRIGKYVVQYFVDVNGVPVRDEDGRLVHFADPSKPELGLAPVELHEGDIDGQGRPLR